MREYDFVSRKNLLLNVLLLNLIFIISYDSYRTWLEDNNYIACLQILIKCARIAASLVLSIQNVNDHQRFYFRLSRHVEHVPFDARAVYDRHVYADCQKFSVTYTCLSVGQVEG